MTCSLAACRAESSLALARFWVSTGLLLAGVADEVLGLGLLLLLAGDRVGDLLVQGESLRRTTAAASAFCAAALLDAALAPGLDLGLLHRQVGRLLVEGADQVAGAVDLHADPELHLVDDAGAEGRDVRHLVPVDRGVLDDQRLPVGALGLRDDGGREGDEQAQRQGGGLAIQRHGFGLRGRPGVGPAGTGARGWCSGGRGFDSPGRAAGLAVRGGRRGRVAVGPGSVEERPAEQDGLVEDVDHVAGAGRRPAGPRRSRSGRGPRPRGGATGSGPRKSARTLSVKPTVTLTTWRCCSIVSARAPISLT